MAPPKQPSGLRRVSSSLSKVSTPSTSSPARANKVNKPSKILRISLSKDLLSRFPQEQSRSKPNQVKASPTTATKQLPSIAPAPSAKVRSEDDTPPSSRGGGESEPPSKDGNQEESPTPKTGEKRALGTGVEGDIKPKTKAPQRKRPKVGENGRLDGRTAAAKAAGFIASAHKLGPKANQGAINAGLRALDRTGKPCRKWQKTGFKIKSFTGRVWEIPSWRTPNAKAFGLEGRMSNDQSKENSSSAIGSDKTPNGENTNVASSPATAVPMPA